MSATQKKYTDNWQRENSIADFIPYSVQLNEHTVKTKSGDFLQVIKLDGIPHESSDPEDITVWKDQLNLMLRNIASPSVSVWTNVVRRYEKVTLNREFKDGFDRDLNNKYEAHLNNKTMMVNELYLTVIYRPSFFKAGFFSTLERNLEVVKGQQQESIEALMEVVSIVQSSLIQYSPRLLGTYLRNEILHSEILEFFDLLINGDSVPRALPKKTLDTCLARNRVFFGSDSLEIWDVVNTKVGAILGILEYPSETESGLLNALLSAPFEFILSQSFNFLSKPVATEILQRQQKRMLLSGDLAESQVDEITDALDDLVSNRFVLGEHHLTLAVFAKTPKELKLNLSGALATLSDSSMVVAREDWAIEAAYWSQLPSNHEYRPRPAPITSLNFAGFSSLHNYPIGRAKNNQWGDAVTAFRASSKSPYYFNFHEPLDNQATKKEDSEKEKDGQKTLGNTLIIGPSGSGKTVVQGFLISQSKKFNPTQVIFDKDRGLEIYVRASKGLYLPLLKGERTGFNPFQLDPTEENIMFLNALIKNLCGGSFTVIQDLELDNAIRGVMSLPKALRKLARCQEFLDPVDENGTYAKLKKWCGEGSLAWVLDNDEDTLTFGEHKMFGFDVTDFIDMPEIRTPIIMYLFHRIEGLIDGRPLQIFLDEFWKLLLDEYFEDFAQNKQKVIRKQNGIMVYGTQSAKDALDSDIAHTLIEQCATMVLMPNPKAKKEHYVDGLGLTHREFDLIRRELMPNSRQFLIKQGHSSVVAELNLEGFADELAVISGTTDNVNLVSKLIDNLGDDPADWLPEFHKQRV